MWYPQQELTRCLRYGEGGDPWGIRTPDGLLDREVLYQAELTGQKWILRMESLARLKLATSTFGGLRSIRLSYGDAMDFKLQNAFRNHWLWNSLCVVGVPRFELGTIRLKAGCSTK